MNIFNIFKRNKFVAGVLAPDPTDVRDYQLCDIQPEATELPEEFDLRDKMSPIGYQNYGSCTSWGTTSVKEYLDNKEYHKIINLSEKFVYHFTKVESGLWGIQGDYVRSALKAICKYGAPLIEDYPDTREKNWETYVKKEPSLEIQKKAEKYKGKTYWSVGKTLESFKQAMYQQKAPIITGMMWHESYRAIQKDGKLPIPGTKKIGGHCVSAIGWTKNKLWFRNSWGTKFGNQGYFYIPFNEFNKHEIWNASVLLDIKPTIGYVAEKYLEKVSSNNFKLGDIVTPTTNLNLRESPTINSNKITLLEPGQKLKIIEGNIIGGNYKWSKIKIND